MTNIGPTIAELGPPVSVTPPSTCQSTKKRCRDQHPDTGTAAGDEWEQWMDWEADLKSGERHEGSSVPSASPPGASSSEAGQSSTRATSLSAPSVSGKRRLVATDFDRPASIQIEDKPRPQERSHRFVEKRYRENINQKIADLRECIGAHRKEEGGSGTTATFKTNKAAVLEEAIAYIHRLEKRNAYLEEVHAAMKQQMQRRAIDSHVEPESDVTQSIKDPPCDENGAEMAPEAGVDKESRSQTEPKGLIPVPEQMRDMWRGQSQEHYAHGLRNHPPDSVSGSAGSVTVRGQRYYGRAILGSLAGFMILDGFNGLQPKLRKRDEKGLSALPITSYVWDTAGVYLSSRYDALSSPLPQLWSSYLLRGFLVFGVLGLMLLVYLHYSQPPPRKVKMESKVQPTSSSTSQLDFRQRAWLTSTQSLWVPSHHLLPEMFALTLETAAYLTRQLLGWRCYSWLTGRTEEEEVARVRAWEIALDAQLSGGDREVTKSRLVLTLWAAGTLPNNPTRLMLKALHIRVLFWQPSRYQGVCDVLHDLAMRLATYQWQRARVMQDATADQGANTGVGAEPVTNHLKALLYQDPVQVLNDKLIQRTSNFVWNRMADDELLSGYDAIHGPLDALAVWFSKSQRNAILRRSLEIESSEDYGRLCTDMDTAINTAPPGSEACFRAFYAKALLSIKARQARLLDAVRAQDSKLVDVQGVLPFPARMKKDTHTTTICVVAMTSIDTSGSVNSEFLKGFGQLRDLLRRHSVPMMGLLERAALRHALVQLYKHRCVPENPLRTVIPLLIPAHKRLNEDEVAMSHAAQERLCEYLTTLSSQLQTPGLRRTSDASMDTGYGTMSDSDDDSEQTVIIDDDPAENGYSSSEMTFQG